MNKTYLFLRKLFFWIFVFLFITITPASVFYSLGYKFDIKTGKLVKTGAVDIKSIPPGAAVLLDGRTLKDSSPCAIQGLIPGQYSVEIQKEGFFPYDMAVEVKQSNVEKIDVVLVPRIENAERSESGLNVLNFFIEKSMLGQKIIAFMDRGVYIMDDSLGIKDKIAPLPFSRGVARSLRGLKEGGGRIAFWNDRDIWQIGVSSDHMEKEALPQIAYEAQDELKEVFFALKDRYLIIRDGQKIIALDTENFKAHFEIFTLRDRHAKIYYNSQADLLYVNDSNAQTGGDSLSKIDLTNVILKQK